MYFQTKITDWVLEPRNRKDDSELKSHFITQPAAEAIAKVWRNSDLAELRDEKGNLADMVSRKDYRLRKVTEKTEDKGEGSWLCGFGGKHPLSVWPASKCGCREKFGCADFTFLEWCQMFHKIEHSYQITEAMRSEYLKLKALQ